MYVDVLFFFATNQHWQFIMTKYLSMSGLVWHIPDNEIGKHYVIVLLQMPGYVIIVIKNIRTADNFLDLLLI